MLQFFKTKSRTGPQRAHLSVECLEAREVMTTLTGTSSALKIQPPTTWIDQNIHDPTIHAMVTKAEADLVLSRNEMMAIFQQVSQDATQHGGLTSTELSDLRAFVSNPSILGMPDYVFNLANKVVGYNQANAHYQGGTLETGTQGLQVGNSGTLLNNLTNKWFLGLDHPALPNLKYSDTGNSIPVHYQLAAGTLFGSGIQYSDIMQGGIADCFLMAPLEATALQAPSIIGSMFIDNGDGTFTVRFYNNTWPDYVTVDRYLPADTNGKYVAANQSLNVSDTNNKLWVALAEKAYAQLDESGWTRGAGQQVNTYDSLNLGDQKIAASQITGYSSFVPTSDHGFPPTTASLISDFQKGRIILLGTNSISSQVAANVVANHVYPMISYINSSGGLLVLDNPWAFNPADQSKSQTLINTLDVFLSGPATNGVVPIDGGFISWAEVNVNPSSTPVGAPVNGTGVSTTSTAGSAASMDSAAPVPNQTFVVNLVGHLFQVETAAQICQVINLVPSVSFIVASSAFSSFQKPGSTEAWKEPADDVVSALFAKRDGAELSGYSKLSSFSMKV